VSFAAPLIACGDGNDDYTATLVCEPPGKPCPSVCPNPEHDCCTTGNPGCSDADCCLIVCGIDPFCCDTFWDGLCVDEANDFCGDGTFCADCGNGICEAPFEDFLNCPADCPSPCPNPEHDCCTQGNPGCSDVDCCNIVCGIDPFCCQTFWDGVCVSEANSFCGDGTFCSDCGNGICEPPFEDFINCPADCPSPCPNPEHDCYTQGNPGCSDEECCNNVCAVDLFCCQTFWDGICVNEAFAICGVPPCPEVICPDDAVLEGEPCGTDTNGGCNSTPPLFGVLGSCGDSVCGTAWAFGGTRDTDWYQFTIASDDTVVVLDVDSSFPVAAAILADGCPPVVLSAFTTGTCGTRTSAILDAGTYVAFVAPSIFDGLPCGAPPASDCCTAHATPGCDDPDCMAAVCAVDPFCCDTQWDGICAGEAATLCGKLCAQEGEGFPYVATIGCCNLSCPSDINGDGETNVDDLLIVIAGWGLCE
jgi:hypothetical protein